MAQGADDPTGSGALAIYAGNDKDHTLKADQVARFKALRARSRDAA